MKRLPSLLRRWPRLRVLETPAFGDTSPMGVFEDHHTIFQQIPRLCPKMQQMSLRLNIDLLDGSARGKLYFRGLRSLSVRTFVKSNDIPLWATAPNIEVLVNKLYRNISSLCPQLRDLTYSRRRCPSPCSQDWRLLAPTLCEKLRQRAKTLPDVMAEYVGVRDNHVEEMCEEAIAKQSHQPQYRFSSC